MIEVPEPSDLDPPRATLLKRQGDEAFVKADFRAASDLYTRALDHDTHNHLIWANRSAAYLRLGRAQGLGTTTHTTTSYGLTAVRHTYS